MNILRGRLPVILVAWGWLGLLWLLAPRLPRLPLCVWLLALLILAALPGWGLWVAFMLRRRALRLQFASGALVWRWLGSPWWSAFKAGCVALALTAATLWQAYFLAPWEWGLLALTPLLYWLIAWGADRLLAPQFAEPGFSWAWTERVTGRLLVLLLACLWIALMLHDAAGTRTLTPGLPPEVLDNAVATIEASRSSLVRWGLDGLLTIEVAGGVLRDLPQSQALRLLLLAFTGPGLMSLCIASALRGASALRQEPRRAARLQHANDPGIQAALAAFIAVVALSIVSGAATSLERLAAQHESLLALQRLPQCEHIDGQYYTIGTTASVHKLVQQVLQQTRVEPALCARVDSLAVAPGLEQAIESYLDWYFSLSAEWGRVLRLLTGGAESLLQDRLQQTLEQVPGLPDTLLQVQKQREQALAIFGEQQQHIEQVLAKNHLALGKGQCLAQKPKEPLALGQLDDARQRLGSSAVAGIGAGAFAGLVAAKAMGKVGMKAAAKVLAKAAAKQGLGKAGAVATGAALGSILPGVGTVAGALAGAAFGTVASIGIDWAALRAEELRVRDAMRDDLRAAMREQLRAMQEALGCTGS